MPDTQPIVDARHADFLQRGVSIGVGACGANKIPTLARGTGCRVSPDCQRVTVFVSAAQAAPVIHCIRANGIVAVVFSEPSTHRTVQLKGKDAVVGDLIDGDLERIAEYRNAFVRQLASRGYDEVLVRTLFAYATSDIVSVTFTPTEAYSQTPGPHAGEPLRGQS